MQEKEEREKASYRKFSDKLRNVAPHDLQCQVFCRGKKCKYEGPSNWLDTQMALDGIFSTWITCNILAMARPNTEHIEKYNLIDQFHKNGIRTIINLQQAGEHAYCGNGLEHGGFSYISATFMENGIFFYNFPWKDYGVASLEAITDVMKVIAFSLVEGKVAVHCHAGLGRTGVVIACYLIYSSRLRGNDAIRYVRRRRPNSIQTAVQVATVYTFHSFISPSFVIVNIGDYDEDDEFTLEEHLKRQSRILHGAEARNYKFLPKFVHLVCERLLQLAGLRPVAIIEALSHESSRTLFWKNFLGMKESSSNIASPKIPLSAETSISNFPFDTKSANAKPLEKGASGSQMSNALKLSQSGEKKKAKGKSFMTSLQKVFKSKENRLKIDEEEADSIVGSAALAQTSKHTSGTRSSASNSQKEHKVDNDGQKYTPKNLLSASNLIDLDDDEPFVTWSRWKKKLLSEESVFEESSSPPLQLLETMERIVSQQSSLVLPEDSTEDLDMDAIYTATLPPPHLKSVAPKQLLTANQLAVALTTNPETLSQAVLQQLDEIAHKLNEDAQNGWLSFTSTTDPILLIGLLYIWLEQLQQPLLSKQDWMQIKSTNYLKEPGQGLGKLSRSSRVTLEYLIRFVSHIEPISTKQRNLVMKALVVTIMQRHGGSSAAIADDASTFLIALMKLIKDK